MTLEYCDLLTTMNLHNEKCAINTLQRIFEIVYILNIINGPVIKQMVHLIFDHNPLLIYKMQFVL